MTEVGEGPNHSGIYPQALQVRGPFYWPLRKKLALTTEVQV